MCRQVNCKKHIKHHRIEEVETRLKGEKKEREERAEREKRGERDEEDENEKADKEDLELYSEDVETTVIVTGSDSPASCRDGGTGGQQTYRVISTETETREQEYFSGSVNTQDRTGASSDQTDRLVHSYRILENNSTEQSYKINQTYPAESSRREISSDTIYHGEREKSAKPSFVSGSHRRTKPTLSKPSYSRLPTQVSPAAVEVPLEPAPGVPSQPGSTVLEYSTELKTVRIPLNASILQHAVVGAEEQDGAISINPADLGIDITQLHLSNLR